VAIKLTDLDVLDPIVAIVVAMMIIKAAWDLTRDSFLELLHMLLPSPYKFDPPSVTDYSHSVTGHHKLRARKSGPERSTARYWSTLSPSTIFVMGAI